MLTRDGRLVTELPGPFVRNIRAGFGAAGTRWLAELPALLAGYADRWALTLGRPYPMTYHCVVAATRADGTGAVLKLGVPGNQDFGWQVETLRLVGGDGMARLLEADVPGGALLLERVDPGGRVTPRDETADPAATDVLLDVMRRLHRPAPAGATLPTVADRGRAFAKLRARHGGGTGPLPADVVEHAERTYAELAADPAAPAVLLHGDLHHENVLRSHRAGWLAIDPAGVLGEPAYEVGPLLLNPWDELLRWPDPARVLARRVDQLAEGLAVDADRVRRWGFAFAVLSAVWFDEDGRGPDAHSLAVADLLRRH
jgi:streptomycin 6-kinase